MPFSINEGFAFGEIKEDAGAGTVRLQRRYGGDSLRPAGGAKHHLRGSETTPTDAEKAGPHESQMPPFYGSLAAVSHHDFCSPVRLERLKERECPLIVFAEGLPQKASSVHPPRCVDSDTIAGRNPQESEVPNGRNKLCNPANSWMDAHYILRDQDKVRGSPVFANKMSMSSNPFDHSRSDRFFRSGRKNDVGFINNDKCPVRNGSCRYRLVLR